MRTDKPRWIPFDPTDSAWAPDKSPDKTGSMRWVGAPEGVLVSISPFISCGSTWYLPGVHFSDGRMWNGTGWLPMEQGYRDLIEAKGAAMKAYLANRKPA